MDGIKLKFLLDARPDVARFRVMLCYKFSVM